MGNQREILQLVPRQCSGVVLRVLPESEEQARHFFASLEVEFYTRLKDAVAANVHGLWVGSSYQRPLVFALVTFPAVTAIPAFLVAFVAATVLRQRNT